jgi:hypothetical protein
MIGFENSLSAANVTTSCLVRVFCYSMMIPGIRRSYVDGIVHEMFIVAEPAIAASVSKAARMAIQDCAVCPERNPAAAKLVNHVIRADTIQKGIVLACEGGLA